MYYPKRFDHRLKGFGDKLPPIIRVYYLWDAELKEHLVYQEVDDVCCRSFSHRLQKSEFGKVIHDDKYPGVSALRPWILPKEVNVKFLKRTIGFAFPHEVANLNRHPGPIKLPAQCMERFSHSSMSCGLLSVSSLDESGCQRFRNPQLPSRALHFIIQRLVSGSLEDESVLDLQIGQSMLVACHLVYQLLILGGLELQSFEPQQTLRCDLHFFHTPG
ncbi:uncharacterized protein LOC117784523 [Drosophila innubila]|uniref:uncharacterized protein LOC117784523 n=1 Tax=Drosophila innubila TaxID=198719 RepID=UPI00148E4657|nr:uncharacterized protein LOC117784523 [Drosophila innubila]